MVITKREDVTNQGLCKILLLVLIQFFWVEGGRTVGANSRLGAYSNKYSICTSGHLSWWPILWLYAEKTLQEPGRKDSVCKQSRDSEPWLPCMFINTCVFPLRTVLKSQQCLHILPDETKSAFYSGSYPLCLGALMEWNSYKQYGFEIAS